MKTFELCFYIGKIHMTEYYDGFNKTEVQSFCRQMHHGKIKKFVSVREVKSVGEWEWEYV